MEGVHDDVGGELRDRELASLESDAHASRGEDIQGIPWDRLSITREKYRQTRLEQYKNYENIPNSGEGTGKDCNITENGSLHYEFQCNTRSVKPTILHFQLRNLVWATSRHDVYLLSHFSVIHWSSLSCEASGVLNVSGHVTPSEKHPGSLLEGLTQTQVSSLAVKDKLLVSGGFQGELICKISYETLLQATGGFSPANLIGSGSFGSVYKGILDEVVVAVKVLYLYQPGALKSFSAECEALRSIRHRNLVKVLTACSSVDFQGNEFKALVYEYMPNGSLESWLHPLSEADDLNGDLRMLRLLQRLNTAIDVASALDYLHHHCEDQIVHCDLKPSNILLDNNMTAHVGDFGLARFIPEASSRSPINQTSLVGLKGTVGYVAPEYGMGSKVTTYGDVYSFGILLLEMFTGKKPTDDMFKDGLQLHNFVKNALPEHISGVLEPLFAEGGEGEDDHLTSEEKCIVGQRKNDLNQECLIAILRIGVACSVESPRGRMDISHVVKELQLVRDTLIGSGVD